MNIDCQVRQACPGAFWPTPQLQAHDAANQTMIQNTTTLPIDSPEGFETVGSRNTRNLARDSVPKSPQGFEMKTGSIQDLTRPWNRFSVV